MQRTRLLTVNLLAGAATIVAIAGFQAWRSSADTAELGLPVLGQVPAFSLTERSGEIVEAVDLQGKVWVVDFIFTHCAGPCPIMSSRMARLQKLLQGSSDIRLVSVSVDPERDSPEVLSEYAGRFGADDETWLFLTGEKSSIYRLIKKGFMLAVDEGFDVQGDGPGIITHSVRFVLVDQQGRIRAYYDGTETETPERVYSDIQTLLAEEA